MNSNNYHFEIQLAKTINGQKNGTAEESAVVGVTAEDFLNKTQIQLYMLANKTLKL